MENTESRAVPVSIKAWGKTYGQDWKAVAAALGMEYWKLIRKVNGVMPFTLAEAHDIAQFVRADVGVLFPDGNGIDPRELRFHGALVGAA